MPNWKEINVVATDIKKHKGKEFIGRYKGSREIETKIGEQVIWQFTAQDGITFGIYGFTNLNRAMEAVPIGINCRIIYRGTENVPTKFGMKDVHQVTVEVEEDPQETKTKELPF